MSAWLVDGMRQSPDALMWRWVMLSVWGAVVHFFLAVSCMSIGLRAKTPGRVWLLNMLWLAGLWIGPLVLLAVGEDSSTITTLVGVFNPLLHESMWGEGSVEWLFLPSAALWIAAAEFVFEETAQRICEYALR